MNKIIFSLLLLLLSNNTAFASSCNQFYPNGEEILVKDTKVLCKNFYAIVWDQKHVANVFSTEAVQPDTKVPRKDAFRPDSEIENSPTPEDYTNTGFDRGHMVPAADSSTAEQMSETFFMTNMTPQYPNVNRIAWKNLEVSVRAMPFKWVVTGAYYANYDNVIGKHKVPIPTALYKIVYLKDNSIVAYEIFNQKENKEAKKVDVSVIEKQTGIVFHKK